MKILKCIALAILFTASAGVQSFGIENVAMAGGVTSDLPAVVKKTEVKAEPAKEEVKVDGFVAGRELLKKAVENIRVAVGKHLGVELKVKVVYYATENTGAGQDAAIIVYEGEGKTIAFMLYRIGTDWKNFPDTFEAP